MDEDKTLTLRQILDKYGQLSHECLSELEQGAEQLHFRRKEVMVPQGEPCGGIYFTSRGLTRVAFRRARKEDTICFGAAGDVFMSFHSLYGAQPAVLSLVAVTDVDCFRIPSHLFQDLRQKYPDLQRWLADILMEQIYSFEELYTRMALATPEERWRSFWDLKADALRAMSGSKLTRLVPLKIIAQYLGMTAQTLSRMRRQLIRR